MLLLNVVCLTLALACTNYRVTQKVPSTNHTLSSPAMMTRMTMTVAMMAPDMMVTWTVFTTESVKVFDGNAASTVTIVLARSGLLVKLTVWLVELTDWSVAVGPRLMISQRLVGQHLRGSQDVVRVTLWEDANKMASFCVFFLIQEIEIGSE
jgi:hypothetical protein